MKIKQLAAMGALGAFALAGPALAEESKTKEQAQMEMGQHQDQQQLKMTVKSVDQQSNKVTFEAELSPTASIRDQQQQEVGLNRLQEGDEVRASFDQSGEIIQLEVLPSGQQQQQQPSQPEQPSPGMEEQPSFPDEPTY